MKYNEFVDKVFFLGYYLCMNLRIDPLDKSNLHEIKEFCDREIGLNYYSIEDLEEIHEKSNLNGSNSSLILYYNEKIAGIRFTYMPTKWTKMKGSNGLTMDKWGGLKREELGYFQSMFITKELMGLSLGPLLSNLSIFQLKKAGAKGVLTHCWKESPNNTSKKYLVKIGFKVIKEHPLYWHEINYECSLCGKEKCKCTAIEMLKVL